MSTADVITWLAKYDFPQCELCIKAVGGHRKILSKEVGVTSLLHFTKTLRVLCACVKLYYGELFFPLPALLPLPFPAHI